jgi:hypothetical protein
MPGFKAGVICGIVLVAIYAAAGLAAYVARGGLF